MTGAQELEEVQPAFAGRGAEPSEMVVADLRAGPIRGLVAGPRGIDRDPGGPRPPPAPHAAGPLEKTRGGLEEEAHDLPRGDGPAKGPPPCYQPRQRGLRP